MKTENKLLPAGLCHNGGDAATKKRFRRLLPALIKSTDVLYQYDSTIAAILWEEADYFYNGVRTAEEAAALIQSCVQTYLAEQG